MKPSLALPDRLFLSTFTMCWIGVYLVSYFFLRDYIPEKYLRDAGFIQDMMANRINDTLDTSYANTTAVFRLLPPFLMNIVVGIINSVVLWFMLRTIKTYQGVVLSGLVFPPLIILDMLAPSKETLVILTALFLTVIARNLTKTAHFVVALVALYAVYALFFRQYYFIIIAAYLGLLLMQRSIPLLRWVYVLFFLVGLFFVPPDVFSALQGSRDEINYVATTSVENVRSAIFNPFPPDGTVHFIMNYLYAAVRLHLPFVFAQTANELILFLNVVFFGFLAYIGVSRTKDISQQLSWLFLSHVLVLVLFEPDLGSYFRHLSSVFLYLLPAWSLWEQKRAERIARDCRLTEQL